MSLRCGGFGTVQVDLEVTHVIASLSTLVSKGGIHFIIGNGESLA